MQSTVFLLKITKSKKLVVNRLLSKMLIFLIIDFKILGHVEKRNSFQRIPYFQTATCYNLSLVLSRLDPALVKAAYNIACPQLNGDTLISPVVLPNFIPRGSLALPDFPGLFLIPGSKWLPKQRVKQRSLRAVNTILRARLLQKVNILQQRTVVLLL